MAQVVIHAKPVSGSGMVVVRVLPQDEAKVMWFEGSTNTTSVTTRRYRGNPF